MDAHQFLKEKTAQAHRSLESGLTIGKPDATAPDYVAYVAAMYGWMAPGEEQLWSGSWAIRLQPQIRRTKSDWLAADLLASGLSKVELAQLPRHTPPVEGSVATQFGLAYVIEGAQLGGQVLRRRLGPVLEPGSFRWLEGYGAQGASLWHSFIDALNEALVTQADREAAAGSANRAFADLATWFAARGVAV